ncbi:MULTISPECIES: DUF2690 domain-containing protein [Nocardiaceae]|uniref:DUF2690 domain-containing protein n=1 Tax=Nocardiaceae TaxID=85025 RepID=UPI0009B91586|nr:DUF2690 domain-containing protein [Rhodococcus sp. 06-156-4a]OZD15771.1 DUF2690 domain-containing protein [Rhodococcus sp. 06-156-3C]OZD21155.1 DUF2690 domain-containing protein [Rhodococcus sp. 06-156-4C]OZD32337.1 DUF2690 domain-containing protein [Rhodococcus sp. 06-156-3]OZD36559.1 DUF2690 domain-containing protein [Rhodococcus sp. 06-156-3b]OZF59279.1 DUF2690 domain-containing protein [Rhodococcus sp. 06-156-4]
MSFSYSRISALIRLTIVTTVAASWLALALTAAPNAVAGPNHHNTDPAATGCTGDAYTIATRQMPYRNMVVEVRYSPSCATNWLRIQQMYGGVHFYLSSDAMGPSIVESQGGTGGTHWTKQVYAPGATCIGFDARSVNASPSVGGRIC